MTSSSACQFDVWRPDGVFACGTTSIQFLAGAYFSTGLGADIPRFNYVPVSVRYGWMLTDPADSWIGRGNYEWLCDTTAAAITTDYGSWLAGQSYYLRYNFVEPGATVVPYQQVGVGWLLNDAYRDRTQEAIGRMLEFRLHYEIGLKYFVAPNLSLDVEGGFQHISNAGMSRRNHGVNAVGAQVGLTYYFPTGGQ